MAWDLICPVAMAWAYTLAEILPISDFDSLASWFARNPAWRSSKAPAFSWTLFNKIASESKMRASSFRCSSKKFKKFFAYSRAQRQRTL